MTWSESVDEALCVDWIDGVRKRIGDRACQIRFHYAGGYVDPGAPSTSASSTPSRRPGA
ncbi:MAG: hypothetical protein U0P30_14365 [Vicinamibacterales bacterium]